MSNGPSGSIWFPGGLTGHVPRQFEAVLHNLVHTIWFREQEHPRTTGSWSVTFRSKKHLQEVLSSVTPLGLSYVTTGQTPELVASGSLILLFVYFPFAKPLCCICFPRESSSMFPTPSDHDNAKVVVNRKASSLAFPEGGSIPNLPPRTCASCGKKARSRCSACRMVYYCDTGCQKKDAALHGKACNWAAVTSSRNTQPE